ncbi:hypothetical protein ABW19_dt0206615 [Dactylella cylindrospora]|nr:hypothetical protein ABW19_dt0206615 [Dactylella cylindrospora]
MLNMRTIIFLSSLLAFVTLVRGAPLPSSQAASLSSLSLERRAALSSEPSLHPFVERSSIEWLEKRELTKRNWITDLLIRLGLIKPVSKPTNPGGPHIMRTGAFTVDPTPKQKRGPTETSNAERISPSLPVFKAASKKREVPPQLLTKRIPLSLKFSLRPSVDLSKFKALRISPGAPEPIYEDGKLKKRFFDWFFNLFKLRRTGKPKYDSR